MPQNLISNEVRTLAVDPGSGALGWALICYNTTTGTAVVTHRGTLTGQRVLKERKVMQEKFSKAFIILDVYYSIFCQLMDEHQPHYVVSEGAFYHKFAQTYASLTLVIHTLRRACHAKLGTDLYEVAPMETKKLITGKSMADKSQIKAALLAMTNLVIVDSKAAPLEDVTEHEFDAIGHGLTFIARDLPTLLLSAAGL